ncbi:MAG: M56 family metallopeptidase, partial [Oscillospiraceae bacterium]|nr:M56 family metallopeptidase [Oscillospiraceae bacterium]
SFVDRFAITSSENTERIEAIPAMPEEQETDYRYTLAVKQAESPVAPAFDVFMIAYPFGAAAALLYFLISYTVFTRLHRRRNKAANPEETAMLAELCGSRRAPLLYRNPLAATPMLFGVLRPSIILPDREYTAEQLRAVLLHELTHLRRKDVLVKWLSVLSCAAHWFNPVVWLMRREIDRACELACDSASVRNLDAAGRQNYGETLIYVAAENKMPHAVLLTTMCNANISFAWEKKALKERLGAILKNKKHTRVALILSVVLILAVSGTAIALGAGRSGPLIEMKMIYEENPAFFLKDMILLWGDVGYRVTHVQNARPGKEIGYATDEISTWRIFELRGHGRDYLFAQESEDVWRVMTSGPIEVPWRQYILENATDRQRMERMLSVSLHSDGTATLATPLISSFALVAPYYYAFENGELLIGYKNNNFNESTRLEPFARFEVVDDNTIIFKEASVPLFADVGARYTTESPALPDIALGIDRSSPESENDPAPPELDVLALDYPSSIAMDINGTSTIYTSLDDFISFITKVSDNQGWELYNQPTRETATNDIKYLCEMAIERLMWLNDDKDGNLSHPELEADERLAEFLGSGKIIAVPHFEVLLFDVMEERITVIAIIDLHNRDGYCGIALDFLLDSGYSINNVYLAP